MDDLHEENKCLGVLGFFFWKAGFIILQIFFQTDADFLER